MAGTRARDAKVAVLAPGEGGGIRDDMIVSDGVAEGGEGFVEVRHRCTTLHGEEARDDPTAGRQAEQALASGARRGRDPGHVFW